MDLTNLNIAKYWNRYDPDKKFGAMLWRDGYTMMASEMNEYESMVDRRITRLANALLSDGDILAGCQLTVNFETAKAKVAAGQIYLDGHIWDVPEAELSLNLVGAENIGIRLTREIISEKEDPGLLNPAKGSRAEGLPGAWRMKFDVRWSTTPAALPSAESKFFPVYALTDGQQEAKEAPPNLEAFNLALERYDRDSTGGGCYISSGLMVTPEALSADGAQHYSISEGRARVNGEAFELLSSWRLRYAAQPDLRLIDTEVSTASTDSRQRVDVNHAPVHEYINLRVTRRNRASIVHGNYIGCRDDLPHTSVLNVVAVRQGDTVYLPDTDYKRSGDKLDWSPKGNEPSPGSTFEVEYDYLDSNVTPEEPDADGFYVSGAVPGSSIMITYKQALPRIDRLCATPEGSFAWIRGVASEQAPRLPHTPPGLLPIASVYQNWRGQPRVENDGVRAVSFAEMELIRAQLAFLHNENARTRLVLDAGTREAGVRVGVFADPLLDDSMRDQGIPQTAAILDGALMLPITATPMLASLDVATPQSRPFSIELGIAQPLRTGEMAVNPYMAFSVPEGKASITPSVDRWTETRTDWASTTTRLFQTYSQQTVQRSSTTTSLAAAGTTSSSSSSTSQTSSMSTQNLGTQRTDIAYLRQLAISFALDGFGPGELLDKINFGGFEVPFTGGTADDAGHMTGSFTIPANVPAGVRQIAFKGKATTAYATFVGQGTLEVTTLRQVQNIYRHTTTTTTITTVRYYNPDPLAQTFMLETAGQLAGVDLWFAKRGTTNAQVQLRTVSGGFPTSVVLAEGIVRPEDQVVTGGGHTRVLFDAPVPLEAGTEYAIVILCNDPVTALSIASLGDFDRTAQKYVTEQPYTVGVLLSSSNATTWTAHQKSDLTFRLLMASFGDAVTDIDLGTVDLPEGTTDLILMGLAELPRSACRCEFCLGLPDGSDVSLSGG